MRCAVPTGWNPPAPNHRFTPGSKDGSKEVLRGWYPGSDLPLDEAARTRKFTTFGSVKSVLPREQMAGMRNGLHAVLARDRPAARVLYWT